jgi:hypothetical protein
MVDIKTPGLPHPPDYTDSRIDIAIKVLPFYYPLRSGSVRVCWDFKCSRPKSPSFRLGEAKNPCRYSSSGPYLITAQAALRFCGPVGKSLNRALLFDISFAFNPLKRQTKTELEVSYHLTTLID